MAEPGGPNMAAITSQMAFQSGSGGEGWGGILDTFVGKFTSLPNLGMANAGNFFNHHLNLTAMTFLNLSAKFFNVFGGRKAKPMKPTDFKVFGEKSGISQG